MFDRLFERNYVLERHRTAPLLDERLRYLGHLADQEVPHGTLRVVAGDLLLICDYLGLSHRPGEMISCAEIETRAARWQNKRRMLRKRTCSASWRKRSVRNATRWLRFMSRLHEPAAPSTPWDDMVAAFAVYMKRERGLSPRTIDDRCRKAEDFLGRLGATKDTLPNITNTEIDQALARKVTDSGYSRVTIQAYCLSLRAFFRYAEIRGWCREGLTAAIKGPRIFAQECLPTGPSWAEVQRLLATTEVDRPTNIRDRAILLLLAVYGLRNGEIVGLRLEDFDWTQELLFVRRYKTRNAQVYPLSRTVGDAVIRYLREIRPHSDHREVFLTMRPPFRPLRSGLWRIVARRLRPLGVSLAHHGPHALRHACATRLLHQGLSLKEIGDHLGHRDPDTTRIYAKVDLDHLRQVADFDLGGIR
jgi:site-specific recombinase XerD